MTKYDYNDAKANVMRSLRKENVVTSENIRD